MPQKRMSEVVDLVPTSTIEKIKQLKEPSRISAGYRGVRLARQLSEAAVNTQTQSEHVVNHDDNVGETLQIPKPLAMKTTDPPEETGILAPTQISRKASDCFETSQIQPDTVVVVWKLKEIDDWTSPFLGSVCKELLTHPRLRTVVFDFSSVLRMSTAAIGTLVRFRNTIIHLDKTMHLVAGAQLNDQLARAQIQGLFDIHDTINSLRGSEIQFNERIKTRPNKERSQGFLKRLFRLQ